jgi:hypothetical protein
LVTRRAPKIPSFHNRIGVRQRVQTHEEKHMRKALPEKMFSDPEQSRLTSLRAWVLDNRVTEIELNERQFWNLAQLQPLAEKPWATFMGRRLRVPDMPEGAQALLGIDDKGRPGVI